jgi:hypothetical protein
MRRAEGERAYIEGWRGVVRELGGLAPFPSGSIGPSALILLMRFSFVILLEVRLDYLLFLKILLCWVVRNRFAASPAF